MRVVLPYRPPYDWAAIAAFLSARATPGVERVDPSGYHRTILARGFIGTISVAPMAGADALMVDVAIPDRALVPEVAERVARMFDVDSDPNAIAQCLSRDRLLKRACARHSGIRLPGAWDPFELAVRAILGQQISVRAATTIAGRVAAQWGEPIDGPAGLERLFPLPAQLTDAPLEKAGIVAARARTIRELARLVADRKIAFNELADLEALLEIAGIGPWTVQYVAMRALKHADAFPSGDLVLRRAAGNLTNRALDARSERWRPWRAYAVMLLWQGAKDQPTSSRRKADAKVDLTRRPGGARPSGARRPARRGTGGKHTRR